jgi:dTDP-4-amino-4,6-dideoxygalactose transaminase
MSSTLSRTVPVARPSFGSAEERAILEVLRSGWVSQGPRVAEFERRFAEYVGAPEAIAVSSCTTALHLALVAAGVKPGDEVLCPSLSFIATANAIVYAGAKPVFVDIDPFTFNIDPGCVEMSISPRTTAILVVHQVGLPCDLRTISEIAARHNLLVAEDAACAIGSKFEGKLIGAPHSSIACFSFHPRKILTTAEGGMITTADSELASRLRRLRQHAMNVSDIARHNATKVAFESYDEIGYNYRMTDLQAAIGLVQLERLADMLERRRFLAARYSERLSAIPWLIVPTEPKYCRHNFQSYMIRLQDKAPVTRDQLMQELLNRGVSSRRGIMAIHRELPYYDEKWGPQLPVTNLVTDTAVVLPLFYEMTEDEQDYVIECFEEIDGQSSVSPSTV